MTTDSQLIEAASKGDTEAFTGLVLRYENNIRACLMARMEDVHEAEDLAQEVFLIAYQRLAEFDVQRSFGAWTRGIAMNLLRNHRRKQKPIARSDAAELLDLVEQEMDRQEADRPSHLMLDAMRHCLSKLDSDSGRLLQLRYRDEISLADLCRQMRLKHSTLTMKLHRLRLQLRKCIESQINPASS